MHTAGPAWNWYSSEEKLWDYDSNQSKDGNWMTTGHFSNSMDPGVNQVACGYSTYYNPSVGKDDSLVWCNYLGGTNGKIPRPSVDQATLVKQILHVRTLIDAPAAALDRLTAADHFQSLCLSAYILQCEIADVGLWLAARVVPLSWCDAAIAFLKPLDDDVRASLDATWCLLSSLQPPFHRARLATFERQLTQLETVLQRASNALQDVRDQAIGVERELALRRLQLWARDVLSKRHFYSVKVQLRQRHHRGLIPGLFDGLHEESVLTVDAVHATVTVEYPRALDRPGSPRHKIV
ncbi:hypothetical protein SPRG_12918 [Saprolegnia parasitica CBS 223.65]|uniref:SCP domain-containing protein n=1 Tax=Saprolegnia parasitica (strain CBS 223.65) TaxID=695850 RepID=A0A067C2X2_SAPPC|nr:hypothetical protein SPRG_12918 [Saprolegnia parasitica CBS 223.65]KDO21137.1 hypothetical protein SPRG_12918 [Saprolegnia parasitica CBS 223.65]|eukprot:XP_012208137.1 hypothetical protein SPRG_12918 [Saprolegnia parasitica CBS 223.65]